MNPSYLTLKNQTTMARTKKKYKVLVGRTAYADVEVEATCKAEACKLAVDKAHQTIGIHDYSDWSDFKANDVEEITN